MKTYESVVVIDSLLKSEEIDGIIEKFERIINNNGGIIKEIDRWGKKRLAYEVKKRQYGYYVDIVFEAPANLINILEKEFGLDENVLRYLTVHLNKRALQHHQQLQIEKTEVDKVPVDNIETNNELENSDDFTDTTEDTTEIDDEKKPFLDSNETEEPTESEDIEEQV